MRWGANCDKADLYGPLVTKIQAAAVELEGLSHPIIIEAMSGYRGPVEQNADYRQSQLFLAHKGPGPWLTNAPYPKSNHNYGLACDIVPGVWGADPWQPQWKVSAPEYQSMILALKRQGLKWGGDWVHVKGDYDHFYLGPDSPTARMISIVSGTIGVKAIFAAYEQGTLGDGAAPVPKSILA